MSFIINPYRYAAVGGDLTRTFVATTIDGVTLTTTTTFPAHAIGTAAADRYVLVGAQMNIGTARSITSITIGGNAASLTATGSSVRCSAFGILAVPTGTTANIVVTWSGSGSGHCRIGVWNINGGLLSVTPTSTSNDTDGAVSVLVDAGGVAFAIASGSNNTTGTWTGVTEDYDTAVTNSLMTTGASAEFASAQNPLAITITPAAGTVPMTLAASWR